MRVESDADVGRLQAALRDLVALSAVSTAWIGVEPSVVAAGLADTLDAVLPIDFVFVKLTACGDAPVEVTRGSAWKGFAEWLERESDASLRSRGKVTVADVGDTSDPCCGIVVKIGVDGDGGLVAAASSRPGFPTAIDQMLLSFAANQAAIAFENARLSEHRDRTDAELRRAHQRLELMVAERTEQLAVLADEQAALRRMATLIAEGGPPSTIFSATCEEIRRLVGSETAAVAKFEHEPPAIVVVGIAQGIGRIPMQTRSPLVAGLASTEVYHTGRSARVDGRNWSFFEEPVLQGVAREAVACTVATPIAVEGRLWGTMSVSGNRPFPPDTEQRLERFTELLATAIANADGKAELAASRIRVVAASDEARRQIERDLHDGTQQRLVSLGLALRATADQAPPESSLRGDLAQIGDELSDAVTELQELSRGVHPAVLSKGGLGPALRSLARRSVVPVELDLRTDARLPEPIEVAAFYVVSEALANAAKHARASIVDVCLESGEGNLVLSVHDDGVGGADLGGGSGLAGLVDRVEALGGSFDVHSNPGEGTRITAELPLDLVVPEPNKAARPR